MLAIHQYAADFYAANGMADVGCRSMDETALIAIGSHPLSLVDTTRC